MFPLSMARKLPVADNAVNGVVSARLKFCPVNGCSIMPNFSNFLLALFGHVDFLRCQIGCSCFADDSFCVFPICLMGNPDSIVPTELSSQYLHLLRHSWFVSKYCSVDFQLRLLTSKQEHILSHNSESQWSHSDRDMTSFYKTTLSQRRECASALNNNTQTESREKMKTADTRCTTVTRKNTDGTINGV